MDNREADPKAGPAAAAAHSTTGQCPECHRPFFNGWERIQHHNGRHHYLAWTPVDGARLAASFHDGRSLGAILQAAVAAPHQLEVAENTVEGRYLELAEPVP